MSLTIDLILKAQNGSEEAFEKLINDNQGLIWSIVSRYMGRNVESDDLYQLGSIGFIKAVKGFDTSYGTQFSTYAVPKISGEIRRFFRDDGIIKVSRSTKDLSYKIYKTKQDLEKINDREVTVTEIANELGITVEEIAACDNALSSVFSLQQASSEDGESLEYYIGTEGIEEKIIDKLSLMEAMDNLDEKEKLLINLRFFKNLTQTQTAKILGISQVGVSRSEKKILKILKELMSS